MFNHILLAVRPSASCVPAVEAAAALLNKKKGIVTLAHVHGAYSKNWESLLKNASADQLASLREKLHTLFQKPLSTVSRKEILLLTGMPAVELLKLSRKIEPDLIIMGPHGIREEKEHPSPEDPGSVFEQVSRQARCPVMAVTRPLDKNSLQFARLVVATDFSPSAHYAVSFAAKLAARHRSALHIFHVLEQKETAPPPHIEKDLLDAKQKMVFQYSHLLEDLPLYSMHAWEGSPETEIMKFARLKKADAILMAHHSKDTDPESAFLGSTTAQVAMHGPCPVISVNRATDTGRTGGKDPKKAVSVIL